MATNLNLGCGKDLKEGWINIDKYSDNPDVVNMDVSKLDYEDNTADEIWSQMIIEHFPYGRTIPILKEWYRVLREDGLLTIATSNLDEMCKDWLGKGEHYVGNLRGNYGSQDGKGMFHMTGFDFPYLKECMESAGFKEIELLPADHPHHLWASGRKK